MDLLIITAANGEQHDYSQFVKQTGYGWKRSSLDSDKSGRTKDTLMRREKLGDKVSVTYGVMGMTRAQLAQLNRDLKQVFFTAVYDDLDGRMQKQFYCANFAAHRNTAKSDGPDSWTADDFTITER